MYLYQSFTQRLAKFPDFRYTLGVVKTLDELKNICKELKELCTVSILPYHSDVPVIFPFILLLKVITPW